MLKIKYDSQNPHNLTSQGGAIKEDINIRTWWTPEFGVLDESNKLKVVLKFGCWYTSKYNQSGMQPPQMRIDQLPKGKFRTSVDITTIVQTGAIGSIIEQFVYNFTKQYIIDNLSIDQSLIEQLPM